MDDLERDAADTNTRVYEWLARHRAENFFLWVHYFDPHAPYVPHGIDGFEANGRPGDPSVDHAGILDQRRNDYEAGEMEPLALLYAEECSYVDRQLGELLRTLEDFQVLDRSVIVIVGDHGESLGEHDINFSHMGLYDPTVRVPMMLRSPSLGDDARVVEDQVRVQDLYPTALRLMGFRYAAQMDGKNLVPRIEGKESGDLQALLVGRMGKLGDGFWVGLRERQWKYLRTPPPEGREEFYLLLEDPGELNDVSAEQEKAVQAARLGVNAALGGTGLEDLAGADLSAEQRARLEALGYVP
jgi:arylsulfatase A-like enzyme